MDAGAGVTVLHGDITLTTGDTSPFVTQVLIVPIKEYISGTDVLAGRTLNGCFCSRAPQVGFSTPSIIVLCKFPQWDAVALPVPAKVLNAKQYHIPALLLHGASSFPQHD